MTTKWKNTSLTRMITVGFAMGICEESDTWRIVEEKEKGTRQREWYFTCPPDAKNGHKWLKSYPA